jgi:hypothetical protein
MGTVTNTSKISKVLIEEPVDAHINQMPMYPLIVSTVTGLRMGDFNLYGDVKRDTYSYGYSQPSLLVDYGIYVLNDDHIENNVEPDFRVVYSQPTKIINVYNIMVPAGLTVVSRNISCGNISGSRIEWSETAAWCDPSDWAMININVKGRQGNGVVCQPKYHEFRARVIDILCNNLALHGISPVVYIPEDHWDCKGVPPDVLIRCDGYMFGTAFNKECVVEDW